jgi:uncharacterized protein (TIGR02145 family)
MKTKLLFIVLFFTSFYFFSCSVKFSDNSFTDKRDGQIYSTVKIGNLIWMLDNLNYDNSDSYCFDDKSTNCNIYGRLYTWESALKACPSGWRLPTKNELMDLVEYFGGENSAADILTKTSPQGFNANYPGSRYFNGEYAGLNEYIVLWSSTEIDNEKGYCFSLDREGTERITYPDYLKTAGFSVRCVRKAY